MSVATSSPLDKISYEDLYARWERSNWSAMELDFTEDRRQWREDFSDFERRAALWNYAMFFHGEDSVADNLSPYIDAAPREEQKYFLTTQQVDEARHAVFFGRFMREVVDAGSDIASSLEATRPELTWGFRMVFERLDRMADELRKDRSRPKLAQAICLYHMVIEGALAQPGQHFIESYLNDREVLPAFRSGMANVSLDEQRHLGFGVKILHDLNQEDPDCADAVADILHEVIPWTAAVLVPPNWDRRYTECFGFTLEEIGAEGANSIETKLRMAGMPVESLRGGSRLFIPGLTPLERAERGQQMVRAGYLGEKNGPPSTDPDHMRLLFDTIANAVDQEQAPPGQTTIQWDFPDAPAWYVRIDNGSTRAEEGRADDPDLVLSTRFEDFVDLTAQRRSPLDLLVRRRLRPHGSLRLLARLPKLFTA
jgi:ribonucleotide reductase beta subunit family protein with ferritin-like domain